MRNINEIKDLIEKAESEEEVNSIVRDCGFAIDGSSRELSDDELDNVNGGVDMQAFANIIAKFAIAKIETLIAVGMNIKDALAYSLLTMDYEKDDYNTPRIAGVITSSSEEGKYKAFIGIVADNKLLVEEIPYGKAAYISTYGPSNPTLIDFEAEDSKKAAKYIFDEGAFEELEKPVNAVAAIFDGKWDIVSYNP